MRPLEAAEVTDEELAALAGGLAELFGEAVVTPGSLARGDSGSLQTAGLENASTQAPAPLPPTGSDGTRLTYIGLTCDAVRASFAGRSSVRTGR